MLNRRLNTVSRHEICRRKFLIFGLAFHFISSYLPYLSSRMFVSSCSIYSVCCTDLTHISLCLPPCYLCKVIPQLSVQLPTLATGQHSTASTQHFYITTSWSQQDVWLIVRNSRRIGVFSLLIALIVSVTNAYSKRRPGKSQVSEWNTDFPHQTFLL